ncbi:hypothetical protein QEM33_002422 [Pseudomonas putida]|nr:hypothetical protein [Pseudomonas putida]
MGIELDVLVGHPEHDLLFVATQVARAAGLKNPSHAVANYHRCKVDHTGLYPWSDVKKVYHSMIDPVVEATGSYLTVQHLQARSWMGSEAWVYSMLLKGRAPQSEPFRKWVFEEVLPTIRKTGQHNAAEASDPIAVGIMDAGDAKPLTMAARSQRPSEDHFHDPAHPTRTTTPPRRSRNRNHPPH